MVLQRKDVNDQDKWNVESMYSSFEEWQNAFKKTTERWQQLTSFQGCLKEGAKTVKEALDLYFTLHRDLMNLYIYSHLRHDEEITIEKHKSAYNEVTSIFHKFSQETAWLDPELLSFSPDVIESYLSDPLLEEYHFHIEKVVRLKPHTLTPDKEELMAMAGMALDASHRSFSAINDADFLFGKVLDSKGNEKELTHATYSSYLHGRDRTLRENTFKTLHDQYTSYKNTLCEMINGQVQSHVFNMRARGYSSSMEASLNENNIDVSVYHSLIQAVNEEVDALHDAMALRKNVLGVDTLHLYDLHVPLTTEYTMHIPYEEAEQMVIDSVEPMGLEYQEILRKGLQEERWVDRYENMHKRSGAYSSGSYDSQPFILMNYKNILRDVFTLAHEAGHSMHSWYTRNNQPYQYGDYSIFLAEVASTFHEELLMKMLLERSTRTEEKVFIINQKIEDIRATLFRQALFAEFELMIHEMAEKNHPVTPQVLNDAYVTLVKKYYGPALFIDEEAAIEWARIPHFYYNFYVYQYATGISAAMVLAKGVLNGNENHRNAYLNFLKGGSSRYPIELLIDAGVDMRTPQPVKEAIIQFRKLVNDLGELLQISTCCK